MSAKLIAETGDLKGTVLSFEEGDKWFIGRDPEECQLILQDPSTSRKHLVCYKTPDGFVVENISGTNPIKVNDEDVDKPRLLQHGDTVKIGTGTFRFYADTETHVIREGEEQHIAEEKGKPMEEAIKQEEKKPETPEEPAEEHDAALESEHDTIYEDIPEEAKPKIAEVNFGVTETGRWLLKVIGGPNNGAEFYMQSPQSYLVGTDPLTCDIVFHDTSVSRQHARISVNEDESLAIEDLNSRNGVLVDGQKIVGKQALQPSLIVTLGTTSFVVYDREGEMQTIISPLLPSIVKVLQKEEAGTEADKEKAEAAKIAEVSAAAAAAAAAKGPLDEKKARHMSHFVLIAIISGLFILVGVGTTMLFRETPIVAAPQEHVMDQLKQAVNPFPAVQYSFNKGTGNLLLIGHVKTASDKNQLMYNLQGLSFIKNIDDSGVIIDEGVWNEINLILNKNPAWKGISVYSPAAGQFVISGYLETRKQEEQLSDYLSVNFPYVDLLQKKIIVEEDIINQINLIMQDTGVSGIKVQMTNGEVSLTGSVPATKNAEYEKALNLAKEIPGIRLIKNFVSTLTPEAGIINISERYEVTGMSNLGGNNYTVVVNGHILSVGDNLDGMKITSVKPGTIMLEENGTQYRIDFRK